MAKITLSPTGIMIVQAFIDAAIMRAFRKIEGKSEEEQRQILKEQKERNKGLMEAIEKH